MKKMKYEEEKKIYVSFCGSYCRTCDWFTGKIGKTAKEMLKIVEEQNGFEYLFKDKIDSKNLTRALGFLSKTSICSGCKAGGGAPDCQIRKCCLEKGFDNCDECKKFPCQTLRENPGVIKFHTIENLQEIKRIGIEKWINQQMNL